MAIALVAGVFSGTGNSAAVAVHGRFNITLAGFGTATVKVERSFDESATWHVASRDAAGSEAAYEADCSLVADEPESGVLYRLACTAHSSGTIDYRVSQ
ncbi:MAG: hypothetical protein WD044_12440 [Dongiaceae bacterium]